MKRLLNFSIIKITKDKTASMFKVVFGLYCYKTDIYDKPFAIGFPSDFNTFIVQIH